MGTGIPTRPGEIVSIANGAMDRCLSDDGKYMEERVYYRQGFFTHITRIDLWYARRDEFDERLRRMGEFVRREESKR